MRLFIFLPFVTVLIFACAATEVKPIKIKEDHDCVCHEEIETMYAEYTNELVKND